MSDKEIRFTDTEGNTLFTVPDGGMVVVTHQNGDQYVLKCKYVDEKYVEVDGVQCSIHQTAMTAAEAGMTIAPETTPEFNAGYHIVARKPANDLVIVLAHSPSAPVPWVTWQANRDTPTDYYWGIYRMERVEAVADMDRRVHAAREGIPYGTNMTSNKQIRFIDPDYKPLFLLPDGGNIIITYPDGEQRVVECKFLDECHMAVESECYHICQFAELMQKAGATVEPETAPEYVEGYHVVRLGNERDQTIFLGHRPGAELPWVTWQNGIGAGVEIQGGHYYSKKYDARKDYDYRTLAVRDGRQYEAYVPDAERKKPKDRGVPS